MLSLIRCCICQSDEDPPPTHGHKAMNAPSPQQRQNGDQAMNAKEEHRDKHNPPTVIDTLCESFVHPASGNRFVHLSGWSSVRVSVSKHVKRRTLTAKNSEKTPTGISVIVRRK